MMETLCTPLCFRHNCKVPSDGEDRLVRTVVGMGSGSLINPKVH